MDAFQLVSAWKWPDALHNPLKMVSIFFDFDIKLIFKTSKSYTAFFALFPIYHGILRERERVREQTNLRNYKQF